MKTFMEEYGLASVMAACVMFLVVMASPVGGAINGNLKSTATNMGDTGTNVQANAAKSIKSLAGEEEEVPDTIFVGYNSQNQCLVFSHDENSSGYSSCDTKYGDISENSEFSDCQTSSNFATNPAPYNNVRQLVTSVNIENKIKPKNMSAWFDNMSNIKTLDLSNVDTSNCDSMYLLFHKCQQLTNINYGNKFVVPENPNPESSGWLFGSLYSLSGSNALLETMCPANRPEGYTADKFASTSDVSVMKSGLNIDCEGYKGVYVWRDTSDSSHWFQITYYNDNGDAIAGTAREIPEGATRVSVQLCGPPFGYATSMKVMLTDKYR